jgi:hypothetical protein
VSASNKAYIRELEMTIPEGRYITSKNDVGISDTVTHLDIFDNNGHLMEKVSLSQPITRLSGSAITIRTVTVF